MFLKRFSVFAFLLLTLFSHLLFGQDGNSSLLVICFGENGHVAFESLDASLGLERTLAVSESSASTHLRCEQEENCNDIVLVLEHSDSVLLPQALTFDSVLSQSIQVTHRYIEPYFSQAHGPLNPALTSFPFSTATDPHRFRTQPTAQVETINHTVLLI